MPVRVVFRDGDKVPVFYDVEDGQNIAFVPFAKDDDEQLFFTATACSVFLPAHDDTREIDLGLIVYDANTLERHTYTASEALERLPDSAWLPYCLAASFSLQKVLLLESLETFHIYVPSYRRGSQMASLLSVLANAVHENYELRRVDEYLGSVLWIGVLRDDREVSHDES